MLQKSVVLYFVVNFALNILALFGLVSSLNSVGSSQLGVLLAPQISDICKNSCLDLAYKFKEKMFNHLRYTPKD